MKTYITFGQIHTHSINGKTVDKDCVAVINANTHEEGRASAFEWFDGKFHNAYSEEDFDPSILEYYPRGLIELN